MPDIFPPCFKKCRNNENVVIKPPVCAVLFHLFGIFNILVFVKIAENEKLL